MKRRPKECYDLIENITAHHNDWDTSAQQSESSSSVTSSSDQEIVALKAEMAEINKNLMKVLQINQQVKAVTPSCENYGIKETILVFHRASHGQNPPSAYQAPAYQAPGYQAPIHQPPIPQSQVMTTIEFTNYMKASDAILKNMQTNMTSLTNSNLERKNMFGQFMKMNTALSLGLGTLPSNTVTNPKEDLKGITTRSGTAYQGPTIPTTSFSLPQVVERETEPVVAPVAEPVAAPVSALKPNQKPSIPYPGPPQKVTIKTGDPVKFLIPCDFLGTDECIALADLGASINLLPLSVWNKLSLPELTPTLMTHKLADRSISRPINVAEDVYVKVGKFHFLADFVVVDFDADSRVPLILKRSFLKIERALIDVIFNDDPSLSPPNQGMYLPQVRKELTNFEAKNDKSSIDEPPEVKLKDLPSYLEHLFLEGDNKLPFIISKDLSVEEKAALIKVLKSHKQAIAWKVYDIKGIDPKFCTHKILMEDDLEPAMQCTTFQRCMMAIFHDMIEKTMEVFMDGFLVIRNSFKTCLSYLEKMLKRCEDINHCLNWEKSHFMVKEGNVLDHKISKNRIEVDKAKVDVIAKLPHPTTIKGKNYILVAVDYLSKWVEAKALPTNDARVVCKFLKSLFARFGTPSAIISDRGTHFCNDQFVKVMLKYVVTHRLATAYHPEISGQTVRDHHKVQLNELNELHDQVYENSLIYKEKTKRLHDSKIKGRVFNVRDRDLLFNSRLKIFSGKLKTHWSRPFTITQVFPYGTVELS
nr:hypothetical protein [Tanacetum cinerariifolium]